jgi:aspartate/methionine/tyrosine aminotransferase
MRLANRAAAFESSGIRRVFDLAAKLKNPVNLSIGQPDFDVPQPIKDRAIEAIIQGKNGYSQTQGIGPLRERLAAEVTSRYSHEDRQVLITSGTSGALVTAIMALVDPGDEVIIFDPYFVMYPSLVRMAGGVPVILDCDADFQVDLQRVRDAITPRTRVILLNSPANPTGVVASQEVVAELGQIARQHDIALISDEIYSQFCYGLGLPSPADTYDQTIVIDGFSKSYGMTGWRVGWVHGPQSIIDAMAKIQQYTFVCAPQPFQWGALAAFDIDLAPFREAYREKRDRMVEGLKDYYQIVVPEGAFYLFPQTPRGIPSGRFVEQAIARELLIIPGNIFSKHETHFRISYAASNETLDRGIDLLRTLAESF